LLEFYWQIGKKISEKQTKWGSKFLENLSITNLKYCERFYDYFVIRPQLFEKLQSVINK